MRPIGEGFETDDEVVCTSREIVSTWAEYLEAEEERRAEYAKRIDAAAKRREESEALAARVVKAFGRLGIEMKSTRGPLFGSSCAVNGKPRGDDDAVMSLSLADVMTLLDYLESER